MLKVLFFLCLTVLVGGSVLILSSGREEPELADVLIHENLRAFTKKADLSIANTIPAFLALPGELGGIKEGKLVYVNQYELERSFCSGDLLANAKAAVDNWNRRETDSTKHATVAQLREALMDERKMRKPGDDSRYCMISQGLGVESDTVIKYEITTLGLLRRWSIIGLWAAGVAAATLLISANLYYRGVVYVVCGPRKKGSALL